MRNYTLPKKVPFLGKYFTTTLNPPIKTKDDIVAKIHKYNINTVTMVYFFKNRVFLISTANSSVKNMILIILLM